MANKPTILTAACLRLPVYASAFLFVWPLLSLCAAIVSAADRVEVYNPSPGQAALLSFAGLLVMIPDIITAGVVGVVVTFILFAALDYFGLSRPRNGPALTIEPLTFFAAAIFGASVYYPAILSHPLFHPLGSYSVWLVTTILGLTVMVLGSRIATPGRQAPVILILSAFAILFPLPSIYINHMRVRRFSPTPPMILLGIDSVSLADDLSTFKRWTEEQSGSWYTDAVSPALLTNAVWSSILLQKPVREHGIFHTFQSAQTSAGSLVEMATKKGYHTISKFPDQFTCWVGSSYAFSENQSGPVGWRQLATTLYEDASILLPLIRPVLPWIPFSSVPLNHAGVYTYSLDREFEEVFSPSVEVESLVVAHSTYLHLPIYPRYMEMSPSEKKRVLKSPAYRIRDRSFDWQATDRVDDAIPMRQWKLNRLQVVLTEVMHRSRFIERGGKMVLFSDHGNRLGLGSKNFHERRYSNVMFATFGLPSRNTKEPISTMDAGSILGLADREPFAPMVEFALSESAEWPQLVESAAFEWDGRVSLDRNLLNRIFGRLKSFDSTKTLTLNAPPAGISSSVHTR